MFYRIALVDRISYCEGNPGWSRYENLKLAGHAVEVLDPSLHPGLVDEQGNINEAAIVRFREVFKPDYISTHGESAEEILTALAETDKGCLTSPRHFVVFGYVGPDNFGDELLFDIIARKLRAKYPGCFVSLVGINPSRSLLKHGVASVVPSMKADIDRMLNGADALVFMGGMMFDDPFLQWTAGRIDLFLNPLCEIAGQTAATLMAAMREVPTVYLGMGAGPLASPDAQSLVKLASLVSPTYIPRDEETCRLLRRAGVDESLIHRKMDLAFLTERSKPSHAFSEMLEEAGLQDGSYAVVALRDCSEVTETLWETVAWTLDAMLDRYGLRTVFVDFAPEDAEVHTSVLNRMSHSAEAVVFDGQPDEQDVLALIEGARLVVGMRLHCSIVANAFGVQSLGIDYNEKVHALYEHMERLQFLLPMDATTEDADKAMTALFDGADADIVRINDHAKRNRVLALEAFDLLFDIVDAHEAKASKQYRYKRDKALSEIEVDNARRALSELEREKHDLEQRLTGMSNSISWKVGRAITALPRALVRKRGKR